MTALPEPTLGRIRGPGGGARPAPPPRPGLALPRLPGRRAAAALSLPQRHVERRRPLLRPLRLPHRRHPPRPPRRPELLLRLLPPPHLPHLPALLRALPLVRAAPRPAADRR